MRLQIVSKDQAIRKTIAKAGGEVLTLALEFRRLVAFTYIVEHSDSQYRKQKTDPHDGGVALVGPEAFILYKVSGDDKTEGENTYLSHECWTMKNI